MRRKRIDVKLPMNRFTYDPVVLGEIAPVSVQARAACGYRQGVAFMKLTPESVLDLYHFLEDVLCSRFDDRVEEEVGSEWVEALRDDEKKE